MIVFVTSITEQQAVLNYFCAKKRMPLHSLELSKKCKFIIELQDCVIQTDVLTTVPSHYVEGKTIYTFHQFVSNLLIPAYATSVEVASTFQRDLLKHQEHLKKIQSMFELK